MKKIKCFAIYAMVCLLSACGGGGGDPGTIGSDTSNQKTGTNSTPQGVNATDVPVMTLSLTDEKFVALISNTISRGATFYAYAKVKSANGVALPNVSVTFSVPADIATLPQLSALTNTSGIAYVIISPAGLKGGSGSLTASAKLKDEALSASIDFQTSQSNVTLASLKIDQPTISAYQSTGVSAKLLVNQKTPNAGLATVNFSASCGTFSPESGPNDFTGTVTSTYKAAADCGGTVQITASVGEKLLQESLTVNAAKPVQISYSGATVATMVTSRVGGSSASSVLKFRLLDAGGAGLASRKLIATLESETWRAGVTFAESLSQQTLTTNAEGYAEVVVFPGAFPTPVNVRVALDGNETVSSNSVGVSVSSGKATQNTVSLSSELASMEAAITDSVTNKLTFTAADRLGNPVPMGTTVTFITNNGLIYPETGTTAGSCKINDKSQCTVIFSSLGGVSRPADGRVVVLAYMDGEEVFYDLNGNNKWDSNETFEQLGRPFMDTNRNGTYEANAPIFDQLVGKDVMGNESCITYSPAEPNKVIYTAYLSIPETCDTSKWRDDVLVRKQITLVMATTTARMVRVTNKTNDGFSIVLSDNNRNIETIVNGYTVGANSMPTGSKISAALVAKEGLKCKLLNTSTDAVPFQTESLLVNVNTDSALDCATAQFIVTVEAARTKTKTSVVF